MVGYVTLGTNDFPRAAKFYDDLFADSLQMNLHVAISPMMSSSCNAGAGAALRTRQGCAEQF